MVTILMFFRSKNKATLPRSNDYLRLPQFCYILSDGTYYDLVSSIRTAIGKFSIFKRRPMTLKEVQARVGGAGTIERIDDGVYEINFTVNGGKWIIDTAVDKIVADPEVLKRDYFKSKLDWGEYIAGKTQVFGKDRLIEIVLSHSGKKHTLSHEVFEASWHMLIGSERNGLLRCFGCRENAANAYADYLENRIAAKESRPIFRKIRVFLNTLRNCFKYKPDVYTVFKKLETGVIANRVFYRDTKEEDAKKA